MTEQAGFYQRLQSLSKNKPLGSHLSILDHLLWLCCREALPLSPTMEQRQMGTSLIHDFKGGGYLVSCARGTP